MRTTTDVFGRIALVVASALAALVATTSGDVHAQTFPPEVQVGTSDIIDYEFDWARDGTYCPTCNYGAGNSRLSYIDKDHNLWVGYIDSVSGYFYPSNGQAVLVDTTATAPGEIGNGPEWVFSARGSELVYTRWTDGQPRMNLGYARQGGGAWVAGPIANTINRVLPLGTVDLTDPIPSVHYQNLAIGNVVANIYWRDITPGSTEYKVPIATNDPGMTRRWVPGSRDIIITAPRPGTAGQVNKQVLLYHTASGQLEQLTFDAVDKLWGFMWQAPEYNNENVFFAVVGGTQLVIYRNFPRTDGTSRWRVVNSIQMPQAAPYVSSPEPFVHNGRSWIIFTLSADADLHAYSLSQVAIAGVDPANPSLRILTSDANPPRSRRDPEYFVTANGPYIYYNRWLLPTDTNPPINEGVFRVDTGLGPRLPRRRRPTVVRA